MSEDQRYDELIGEALRDARSIQNFLWAEEAQVYKDYFARNFIEGGKLRWTS